ncbi:MAG: class D sortase [Coriobacteriia bacterium]
MDSSEQPGRKLTRRGALSLGLVAVGVLLSAWALVSILAHPSGVADKDAPEKKAARSSSESSDTSATADASRTADATVTPAVAYPANPEKGDVMGALTIPALKRTFPLVQGTGSAELKKGVGHMVETAMPGEPDNCVVSGHRDTVFTDLGKLKEKDLLLVETAKGIFTYQIRRIRIVHKDDRTVVVPADHAVLTVSTCYPFRYVGSAPDRYVLIADLVVSE